MKKKEIYITRRGEPMENIIRNRDWIRLSFTKYAPTEWNFYEIRLLLQPGSNYQYIRGRILNGQRRSTNISSCL